MFLLLMFCFCVELCVCLVLWSFTIHVVFCVFVCLISQGQLYTVCVWVCSCVSIFVGSQQ